jgi:phosphoribosyl-dephospho-CoA transferase
MFSRHDLVWLTPDGWRDAAGRAAGKEREAIGLWEREDWPAIVRRHDASAPAGCVSLGIALPPDPVDGGKPRIGLQVRQEHVVRHTPPLALALTRASAPPAWRAGLDGLIEEAGACGLRAYGSLALQAITGRQYVGGSSDIDLLFAPRTAGELHAGIAHLSSFSALLPLDGEVVFPSGEAVAWKEWRDARHGGRVLAKSIGAVRLADPAALAATLEAA